MQSNCMYSVYGNTVTFNLFDVA
uniref:Uncharacterized protein n=1 Tax=Anguilla anguilla TaxID=7936 RepID=A0A0E9SY71_ANGAN